MIARHRWNRGWLGWFVVLALVSAGCSGDDGGVSVELPASSTTVGSPGTSQAPGTTDAPVTTSAPGGLTDSFRGVTATSIKVGVAVPDFDALQAAGIANYQGDAEIAFQAFFDVINDSGGIFGRQIDPVYVDFDFTRAETQDIACSRFAEDHEVFIVLYGLLGQSNLCLTEIHETMVMTRSFQTTALREASGDTLWLQLNAADDEKTRIMAGALAEAGRLDGKTIGIISRSEDETMEGQALQQVLADLGFESLLQSVEAPGTDPVATRTEMERFAERFRVEGVDFVFELTGGGDNAALMAAVGFTPLIAYKNLGAAVDGSSDRAVLDGHIGVGEINEQAMFDDPDFQASCMQVVLDRHPDLADEFSFLPTGDQQAAGAPDWVNPVMIACDQVMLLKALGEIAGADLTNETFRAALDELGRVELHGYGQASFGSASKWDGLDEFYIQEYDFASDEIVVVGDAVVVDR